jgi:hypothetical protein
MGDCSLFTTPISSSLRPRSDAATHSHDMIRFVALTCAPVVHLFRLLGLTTPPEDVPLHRLLSNLPGRPHFHMALSKVGTETAATPIPSLILTRVQGRWELPPCAPGRKRELLRYLEID